MVIPPALRSGASAHATASALLASLLLAMLYALPRLNGLCVPLVWWQPASPLGFNRDGARATCTHSGRACTGVLLIGALSNAGGLAFLA